MPPEILDRGRPRGGPESLGRDPQGPSRRRPGQVWPRHDPVCPRGRTPRPGILQAWSATRHLRNDSVRAAARPCESAAKDDRVRGPSSNIQGIHLRPRHGRGDARAGQGRHSATCRSTSASFDWISTATARRPRTRRSGSFTPASTPRSRRDKVNGAEAAGFRIAFDRGDVAWLRGYCHLLMTFSEVYLAHDAKLLFEHTAHLFFVKPTTPFPFLKNNPKGINDLKSERSATSRPSCTCCTSR